MTISASISSAKSENTLRLQDKTALRLSDETGTIRHIEPYEQSLTRRAAIPRNRMLWDTRPIPSAKGANGLTRCKMSTSMEY